MFLVQTKTQADVFKFLQFEERFRDGLEETVGPSWKLFKQEEFENRAIFLRLGLPSPLIRHENALQTGGIWKRWLAS